MFSDVLPLFACAHEFSWPRKLPSGDYYQVCLRCGAEYGYDWNTMRRTDRVSHSTTVQSRGQKHRASGWRPRARRIHLETPIQFRVSGSDAWSQGTVRNVSQSGVYFVTDDPMPPSATLEVIFTMPSQIAGHEDAKVFCRVKVTRTTESLDKEHPNGVAFEIETCDYLHERQEPQRAAAHV